MKSHLSPARQRLLEIIKALGFGVIEELTITHGEPCFDHFPRILQDIKIGADAGPLPEGPHQDVALKSRMVELFEHLDRLGSTKIKIEVKHSQPFRITAQYMDEQLLGQPAQNQGR